MPSQLDSRCSVVSLVANATGRQTGRQLQDAEAGGLPLCDLLYTSWGGAPPFSNADMQMYECWRCRTLALRSLSCTDTSQQAHADAAPDKRETTAPHWGGAGCKADIIEEEQARRNEGFSMVRNCLPKGLPMDLVERMSWAECLSFFCKKEASNRMQNSSMQPLPLTSLVARLAYRLWFLFPGAPNHLLLPAASSHEGVLAMLPPWVTFFCEELAAFFLFVLLHMKALIDEGSGVYVHLTDREWSSRFRQLKWLLTHNPSPQPSLGPCVLDAGETAEKAKMLHLKDKRQAAFRSVSGKRGVHLSIPPLECIDTSLSEHFPSNPQSAPHSFWLLFDRRALCWVVCTESDPLRSFPVCCEETTPPADTQLNLPSEGGPQGPLPSSRRKRPLPSLVDAAREDALSFLCLLGALPASGLSGNTNYLDSLLSRQEEEEQETPDSCQQQQQQQELREQQHVVSAASCVDWAEEKVSFLHSEVSEEILPHHQEALLHLEPLWMAGEEAEKTEPAAAAAAAAEAAAGAYKAAAASLGADENCGVSTSGAGMMMRARAVSADSSDSEGPQEFVGGRLSLEEEKTEKGSRKRLSRDTLQTDTSKQPSPHKRRKQQQQQQQQQQQEERRAKKQHSNPNNPNQQHPQLQRLLVSLLQGGRKELCGGRVLVGLRHRNSLLDAKLTDFCREMRGLNDGKRAGEKAVVTEGECVAAVQVYMQQHCERHKKTFCCDDRMKDLTGRSRLPQAREALTKALKAAGLIEHFMVNPKDLKDSN